MKIKNLNLANRSIKNYLFGYYIKIKIQYKSKA